MLPGEFDLIARYFTRTVARSDVLLGIGDDAAIIAPPADRRLVIAMDTIVEGVHFPSGTEAADIGYRALAVNLSDLAAMGAEPAWMTLSLATNAVDERWFAGFAAGLFELADRHNVALVGGDTVRGPLVVTVQIGGYVEGVWLTRSGARPGDLLLVSGIPGEAAAGLTAMQRQMPSGASGEHLRNRFLRPTPRVELGRRVRTLASAAMDVSDGLLIDLDKICAASGCGARLDVDALPRSPQMRAQFDAQACDAFALAGGDDYELLITVPPANLDALHRSSDVMLTQIGIITQGSQAECVRNGAPFAVQNRGYDHFAQHTVLP